MTPAAAIAALDQQLAAHGQGVQLRRFPAASDVPVDLPCRAFVRGYTADELVGGIMQTDSKFILSPSQIISAAWPGAVEGEPWPVIGDWLIVLGRPRRIEHAQPVVLADVVVRIEGRIRG